MPVDPEDAVASCQQVRDRISRLGPLVAAESGVISNSKTDGLGNIAVPATAIYEMHTDAKSRYPKASDTAARSG